MQLYKKGFFIALLGLGFLSGCIKGKKVHCKDYISEIPFTISLLGFSAEIADTMHIISYSPGSNFTGHNQLDTIFNLAPSASSDTIFTSIACGSSTECKIYFQGEKDTFYIKDVRYRIAAEWDDRDNCNAARMDPSTPNSINLNGTIVVPDDKYRSIYLKK